MKKTTKVIRLTLNHQEFNLTEELVEAGWRRTDIFRQGLRLLYRREFPSYIPKKLEKDLEQEKKPTETKKTMEQECLDHGGEIVEVEGIKKCRIRRGNLDIYTTL